MVGGPITIAGTDYGIILQYEFEFNTIS